MFFRQCLSSYSGVKSIAVVKRSTQAKVSPAKEESEMALPTGDTGYSCKLNRTTERKTREKRAPNNMPPAQLKKAPIGKTVMRLDKIDIGCQKALVMKAPNSRKITNTRPNQAKSGLASLPTEPKMPGPISKPRAPANPIAAIRKAKGNHTRISPATSPTTAPTLKADIANISTQFTNPV